VPVTQAPVHGRRPRPGARSRAAAGDPSVPVRQAASRRRDQAARTRSFSLTSAIRSCSAAALASTFTLRGPAGDLLSLIGMGLSIPRSTGSFRFEVRSLAKPIRPARFRVLQRPVPPPGRARDPDAVGCASVDSTARISLYRSPFVARPAWEIARSKVVVRALQSLSGNRNFEAVFQFGPSA